MHIEPQDEISKSGRKRAARKIQALARSLVDMPGEQMRRLVQDPELVEAIEFAGRLKRGAAKRQTMRIARLLRDRPDDCRHLESGLAEIQAARTVNAQQFQRIESMRDKFLRGDTQTCELIRNTMDARDWNDLKRLRERCTESVSDSERRASYRKIFRAISTTVDSRSDG